jgi:S-DNA-T family DNA segregation ATPase FtsK/SpoIIIE
MSLTPTSSTERLSLTQEQVEVIATLLAKMTALGVKASPLQHVTVGPIVSIYRFQPADATRVSTLEGLAGDFAVALGVEDVLVKRMTGDSAVGVFVPNKVRKSIGFLETTANFWVRSTDMPLPLNMGITQTGDPLVEDLSKLPHLLIAGTTGSGKSTLLTTLIMSLIARKTKDEVQLVLSDTKGVEFNSFKGIPHLLFPPSTDVETTLDQMMFLIDEMDSRLRAIGKAGWKNIHEYNIVAFKPFTYMVLVIDELADILLYKGEKRGETKIGQDKLNVLTQKARASGIHIVAATQRPSVNIVSGSIKANFPARLTFRLPSGVDSRTVLGTEGAEHLLSQGDMLYTSPNSPSIIRAHAPLTRSIDIEATIDTIKRRNP